MHIEQQKFCERVKEKFPSFFKRGLALDFGSLDVNGTNKYLFADEVDYIGIDLGLGPNVNVVCRAKDYKPASKADVVISTEMLEHDCQWEESLQNMYEVLKPGGLMLFTCATTGRPEHGTTRTSPQDAPFVGDYYRNLTIQDIESTLPVDGFEDFCLRVQPPADLQFWGLKSWKVGE